MEDNTEVKPCPCCGNQSTLRTRSPDYFSGRDWTKQTHQIKCTVCPVKTGWLRNKEKLIVAWNTRANATTQLPPIEGLEEDIELTVEYSTEPSPVLQAAKAYLKIQQPKKAEEMTKCQRSETL